MTYRVNRMMYKLAADGRTPVPCDDVIEFAMWYEHAWQTLEIVVAKDEIFGVSISTVFLGIDRNFTGEGPPVLWETLVEGDGGERIEHYVSREDAERGHARWIGRTRERMS